MTSRQTDIFYWEEEEEEEDYKEDKITYGADINPKHVAAYPEGICDASQISPRLSSRLLRASKRLHLRQRVASISTADNNKFSQINEANVVHAQDPTTASDSEINEEIKDSQENFPALLPTGMHDNLSTVTQTALTRPLTRPGRGSQLLMSSGKARERIAVKNPFEASTPRHRESSVVNCQESYHAQSPVRSTINPLSDISKTLAAGKQGFSHLVTNKSHVEAEAQFRCGASGPNSVDLTSVYTSDNACNNSHSGTPSLTCRNKVARVRSLSQVNSFNSRFSSPGTKRLRTPLGKVNLNVQWLGGEGGPEACKLRSWPQRQKSGQFRVKISNPPLIPSAAHPTPVTLLPALLSNLLSFKSILNELQTGASTAEFAILMASVPPTRQYLLHTPYIPVGDSEKEVLLSTIYGSTYNRAATICISHSMQVKLVGNGTISGTRTASDNREANERDADQSTSCEYSSSQMEMAQTHSEQNSSLVTADLSVLEPSVQKPIALRDTTDKSHEYAALADNEAMAQISVLPETTRLGSSSSQEDDESTQYLQLGRLLRRGCIREIKIVSLPEYTVPVGEINKHLMEIKRELTHDLRLENKRTGTRNKDARMTLRGINVTHVDMRNWYCECKEFYNNQCSATTLWTPHTEKTLLLTEILKQCPSRVYTPLPMCEHILAVLIAAYNKTHISRNELRRS